MTGNEKENAELLAYVRERLLDDRAESDLHDDDRLGKWYDAATPAEVAAWQIKSAYGPAKAAARRGDFAPLLAILTTYDPELADLITGKKQQRQRWSKRRQRRSMFVGITRTIASSERRDRVGTVKRIREIVQEKLGKSYGIGAQVKEIAVEVLGCEPEEIEDILKRGR